MVAAKTTKKSLKKKGSRSSSSSGTKNQQKAVAMQQSDDDDDDTTEVAKTATTTFKKEKKSKMTKKKKKVEAPPPPVAAASDGSDSEEDEDEVGGGGDVKLTLEALDAMSDDDSDDDDDEQEGEAEEEEDYDAEAQALRQMIQSGKFDALLKDHGSKKKSSKKNKTKDDGDDDDGKNTKKKKEEVEDATKEESEEEKTGDSEEEKKNGGKHQKSNKEEEEVEEEDSDSDDDNAPSKILLQTIPTTQSLALTTAIQEADRCLPWPESFCIVPPTPLPFGPPASTTSGTKRTREANEDDEDDDDDDDEHVDVHDDLKREVAFYDNALESVLLAREKCEGDNVGIPFTRPDDFFAEMVKSDDHMAKIKDRLIFETKKMEAVERRKSNKEQTVMAKERHAHRLSEKSKQKKAHMSAVEDWKKNAERGRSGLGGKVREDDEDQLRGMGGGGDNKKRMAANKRYGFGGQRSRFKQNDSKTLNDMSGYNPRGGFGGVGQKSQGGGGGKKKGGGGNKRQGKRARDAARSR